MYLVQSVLIGVLSSLAASALFLVVLFRLRPEIEISPYIAVGLSKTGKKTYRFKFVNRAKRNAINVRARVIYTTPKNVPDGTVLNNRNIGLTRDLIFELPKFDTGDKEANYAYRLMTSEDLEDIWSNEDSAYVRFQLIATDALTGFSRVFHKSFHTKRSCLRPGSHRFGESLEVAE